MSGRSRDALDETLAVFDATATPRTPLTASEIADDLDCTRRTAYDRLTKLSDRGDLRTKKIGARGRVWWREPTDSRAGESVPSPAPRETAADADASGSGDDALFVVDADGDLVRANERAETVLGVAGGEAPSAAPFRDAEGGRLSFDAEPVARTLRSGEPVSGQVVRVRDGPDGSRRPVSVTTMPISGDDGDVERVAVSANEVPGDEGRGEQSERPSGDLERELDDVFERIDDAFCAVDDRFRLTFVNEEAERVLRQSASELLGERVGDLDLEATGTDVCDAFHRALDRQEPTSFETYVASLDRWLEANVYPSESGLSVYFRDVTERRERDRELELYERIVETVGDGVYALDEQSNFVMVNEAFCELVGWEREELLGRTATVVYDDDLAPSIERRAEAVATGDSDVAVVELDLHTKSGGTVPVEGRFVPFAYGDEDGRCGVVRDVSHRIERERELVRQRRELQERESVLHRAYEVIADPDRSFDEQVDDLLTVVRETLATDYATLSQVCDDEYRFEAVDAPDDADIAAGDSVPAMATVCERVVDSGQTLVLDDVQAEAPELADRVDGADWGITSYLGAPVTVDGEVYGTFCFYDGEARSDPFSDWEVAFVDLLSNWVGSELQRRRYTDRLAALNELNDVARNVVDAVIEQSTREEIERTVCEQLAAADSYEFAWIADVDPATGVIQSRMEAGPGNYLDAIDLSVSPAESIGRGPGGRAFRTGETQVSQDVLDDPAFEPWRDDAERYGFRSMAAIPIVHEETLYGVLGLYSDRVGAFADEERRLVDHLGEIVGHAIGSTERKRALMSDEVVEVEFRVGGFLADVDDGVDPTGDITLDQTIPVGDGEFLVYGTATPDATDSLGALVEALPDWDGVTVRSDDDPAAFELRLSEPPIVSTIASLGGDIDGAAITDGDLRITAHLSPSVDVRQLMESVRESYPSVEMLRRQQITRPVERDEPRQLLETDLTDRQRAALRSAYHSGFFAWPRESSGEEVASSLGVSPPTFHQHLRKAEQKVFDALLGATGPDAD